MHAKIETILTLSDFCWIYFRLSNWISQPEPFVRRLKHMHWTRRSVCVVVNLRYISHFVDLLSFHTLSSAIDPTTFIPNARGKA